MLRAYLFVLKYLMNFSFCLLIIIVLWMNMFTFYFENISRSQHYLFIFYLYFHLKELTLIKFLKNLMWWKKRNMRFEIDLSKLTRNNYQLLRSMNFKKSCYSVLFEGNQPFSWRTDVQIDINRLIYNWF